MYLIHFSDYIIDQHNGHDSPQSLVWLVLIYAEAYFIYGITSK
jgi:hypothetical protein